MLLFALGGAALQVRRFEMSSQVMSQGERAAWRVSLCAKAVREQQVSPSRYPQGGYRPLALAPVLVGADLDPGLMYRKPSCLHHPSTMLSDVGSFFPVRRALDITVDSPHGSKSQYPLIGEER